MNSNSLFKELWFSLCTKAFSDDINRIYNIQSLALTVGGFANIGFMLGEYRFFVMESLNPNNQKFNIHQDELPKLAIRAIIHARKISQEIITALHNFPTDDGFIKMTIIRLSNKDDSIYKINNKAKPIQNVLNISTLVFFDGISPENIPEIIEDTVYILEKTLRDHPQQRIDIIRRLLYCLIESVHEPDNIKGILNGLLGCINKNDIVKNKQYVEETIIPSVDSPACKRIWTEVMGCL